MQKKIKITHKLIKKMEEAGDIDGLKLVEQYLHPIYQFEPRPDRPELHDEMTSFWNYRGYKTAVLLGGNGSSKSWTTIAKAIHIMMTTPAPRRFSPIIFAAESHKQVGTLWQQKWMELLPPDSYKVTSWRNRAANIPYQVEFCGYTVTFLSYNQDSVEFASMDAHGVLLDENAPFNVYIEAFARLRVKPIKGLFNWCMTPVKQHDELREAYNNQDMKKSFIFFHLNTLCNPYLSDEWKKNFVDAIPDDFYATRIWGGWSTVEGAIFSEFKQQHIIEDFAIPMNWEHFRGIDTGTNHPTACSWIARNDGVYYIHNEYMASFDSIENHAKEINKIPVNEFCKTWCDYGGPGAQFMQEFPKYGINAITPKKDVWLSIERIKSLFKRDKIKVFRSCKKTISQLRGYQVNPSVKKIGVKDINNDLVDAVRYSIYNAETSDTYYSHTTPSWRETIQV